MSNQSDRISPTAWYTATIWRRNDLLPFRTPAWLSLVDSASRMYELGIDRVLPEFNLARILEFRHTNIDLYLEGLIAEHGNLQILELAAGVSGRGLRFAQKHSGIQYIEADLPAMQQNKLKLVAAQTPGNWRSVPVDILVDQGPLHLENVCERNLSSDRPTVVITEGLINYFPRSIVRSLWNKIAAVNPQNELWYLSDCMHELRTHPFSWLITSGQQALDFFVRGKTHLHGGSQHELARDLQAAGFENVSWPNENPQKTSFESAVWVIAAYRPSQGDNS